MPKLKVYLQNPDRLVDKFLGIPADIKASQTQMHFALTNREAPLFFIQSPIQEIKFQKSAVA